MKYDGTRGSMQTYAILRTIAIGIVLGLNVFSLFLAFTDQSLDTSTMLFIPANGNIPAGIDIPASVRLAALDGKPRVLLGIFSPSYRNKFERMRRRDIRQTYLQFHDQFNTTNRICSMDEASKMDFQALKDCQMIYTFIFQDGESESKVANYQKPKLGSSGNQKPKETDSILLKTANQLDTTLAIQRWMTWSSELIADGSYDKIDYVTMVNTEVFLLPGIFWNENSLFSSFQSSTVAVLPLSDDETCSETRCIDKRFISISNDILNTFSKAIGTNKAWDMWSELRDGKLGGNDVSLVDIKGVAPVADTSEMVLHDWNQYIYRYTNSSVA